jgi:hypothetical protein
MNSSTHPSQTINNGPFCTETWWNTAPLLVEGSRLVQLFPSGFFCATDYVTQRISMPPISNCGCFSSNPSWNILQKVQILFLDSNLLTEKCLFFRLDGILRNQHISAPLHCLVSFSGKSLYVTIIGFLGRMVCGQPILEKMNN